MREFPHLDWKRTPVTLVIAIVVIGIEIACSLDDSLRAGELRHSLYTGLGINRSIWLGEWWRPFTSNLMHADLLHAAFNVYWFLIFAPVLERHFGSLKCLGIVAMLGYVSLMVEFVALGFSRHDWILRDRFMIVGLSGVVYGLFGMLYVGRKSNPEMAEVCNTLTRNILIGWFFLGIVLTYLNLMRIANLAHAAGFVFGGVYGYAAFGREGKRHLGWLCGATVMTAAVLATLIACPGHKQYEQAQKWKAIQGLGTLQRPGEKRAQSACDQKHQSESPGDALAWSFAGLPAAEGILGVLAADTIDPVEAGRRGFVSDWDSAPPWYDKSKDAAQPVDLRKPWWDKWEPPERTGSGPNTSWLRAVGWILVLIVGAGVVLALIQSFRMGVFLDAGSKKRPRAAADKHRIEALPFPVDTFDGDFYRAAEAHYQAGRYGEATKFLFCYQLVELDRARCIRLARGKTNRGYLREMRSRVTLAPWIEDTMIAFEDYFFGNHQIDRGRFERCWNQLPRFREFLQSMDRANSQDPT